MKKFKPLYYYVALANLTCFLGHSMYILLPVFLKQMGASESYIGIMHNVDKIMMVITSILIASYARVKNKINLLRMGYIILLIVFISYFFISSLSWHILVIRIFHGVGFFIAMTIGTNIIFDIVPMKDAAEAVGVYSTTGAITGAISPFIGEMLLSHGYSFYYIIALSALLLFISSGISLVMPATEDQEEDLHGEGKSGFLHLFASARFTIIIIATTIFGGTYGVICTYLPNFVLSTTGYKFSWFFIFYIAMLILIRFKIVGRISRMNVNRVLIAAFLLGTLLNVFMNFLYSVAILIGIGIMYGITHGILFPMLNTITVNLAGKSDRTKANALYMAAFYGGMMLFSLPLGYLIDYSGTYLTAFDVCGISFFIGMIMLVFNAKKYGPINMLTEVPVAVE